MGNHICNSCNVFEKENDLQTSKANCPVENLDNTKCENNELKLDLVSTRSCFKNSEKAEEIKIAKDHHESVYNYDCDQNNKRILMLRKIQVCLKENFYLREKTEFLHTKKLNFLNEISSINGKFNIPSLYFSEKVLQIDSQLPPLTSILQEKYSKLFFHFTSNSKWRISLPPVKTEFNEIYNGSWNILTNNFNGYGVLASKNGSKLEGIWLEGSLHFYGRIILFDGDYYEGDIIHGKSDGFGTFKHYQGGHYIGQFLNDEYHGVGQEHFPDHAFYKGEFFEGKKSGKGLYTWSDHSYAGELNSNKLEGYGEFTWNDGRFYRGEFKADLLHGYGIYYHKDHSIYEGEFVDNRKHGLGKYMWSENKYYEGSWSNGKQHGYGILYKEGKTTFGLWNEGSFFSEII